MFVATLRFTMQPEKKVDAMSVLNRLCSQAGAMPGCQLCRVYGNIGLDNSDDEILLIERWDSKEHMEKHILSPIFQQLIEIMDFAVAPPVLVFDQVAATEGIDMLEELCRSKLKSGKRDCFQ